MNMNVQAMSFTLNLPQPTGTPPSEHGTASEGGRRQPAGQADALQVSYREGAIQMDSNWIATISLDSILVTNFLCPGTRATSAPT